MNLFIKFKYLFSIRKYLRFHLRITPLRQGEGLGVRLNIFAFISASPLSARERGRG
jgi:hypothetical protein